MDLLDDDYNKGPIHPDEGSKNFGNSFRDSETTEFG